MSTETVQFMETLFGGMPAGSHILIWTLLRNGDKESVWCTSPAAAARVALARRAKGDVYVGAALSPEAYGTNQRCKAADALGIGGFWIDVDYADPVHKKENLPPSEAAAIHLIGRLPLDPTFIVHSGHGLQAWWAFEEPYIFDDEPDRSRVAGICAGWQQRLRTEADIDGWDVDVTADLARVMRVPGTLNHKAEPVAVRLI